MSNYLMIADDLTGANGAGVLLKKLGLRVLTLLDLGNVQSEALSQYDVIIHPTDSRGVSADIAYMRVKTAVQALKSDDILLYSKRIDSTFRGNIGAEIDALLDTVGDGTIAVVVPAFPSAGRVCREGLLYLDGVPLADTDAGRDAKAPVDTSCVVTLLKKQTSRAVRTINLDCVARGSMEVAKAVSDGARDGGEIFLVDAVDEEDIATIAEGAILSGVPFVTADPGPFTAAVIKRMMIPATEPKEGKILLTIGSVTDTTRKQVEYFLQNHEAFAIEIDVDKLLESEQSSQAEMLRVKRKLDETVEKYRYLTVLLSSIKQDRRVDFLKAAGHRGCLPEEVSVTVNEAIAEVSLYLLEKHPEIRGVYSSGGDITVALCKRLGATGLELINEVIPLAAYGKIVGGKIPGLGLVTKGGIVGDETAAAKCVEYLAGYI